jgi:hypothetical protein
MGWPHPPLPGIHKMQEMHPRVLGVCATAHGTL